MNTEPPLYSINYIQQHLDGTNFFTVISKLKKAKADLDPSNSKYEEDIMNNLALAYLGLEMVTKSIETTNLVIKKNKLNTFSYLIKGIAYNWIGNDDASLTAWKEGIEQGGQYAHYSIMSSLINDSNFRSYLYSIRFNLQDLFSVLESWNSLQSFTNNDIQGAFHELKSTAPSLSITHFTQILAVDPENSLALLGRGIGHCLTGQWKLAIIDITKSLSHSREHVCQALQFRAVAYMAEGELNHAVSDLSLSIARNPSDSEPILFRARIQARRQLYKQALRDFTSVDPLHYGRTDWAVLADCQYHLGDLRGALVSLEQCQPDGGLAMTDILVLRDLGQSREAMDLILGRLKSAAAPLLQRRLADLLLEGGNPHKAASIYEEYHRRCPNDVTAVRLWAVSLFECGELRQAIDLLAPLSEVAGPDGISLLQERSYPELAAASDLQLAAEPILGRNLMQTMFNDAALVVDVITNIDRPLLSLSSTALVYGRLCDQPEQPLDVPEFTLKEFKPTEVEIKMMQDADRLGRRCVSAVLENFSFNPRVVRALGLAVLMFASVFRRQVGEPCAQVLFETFEKLITLADPTTGIEANNQVEGQSNPEAMHTPTYFIIRGQRTSPRFAFALKPAVEKMKKHLMESPEKTSSPFALSYRLDTVESIYSTVQKDLCVSGTWQATPDTELPSPALILQYLGVYGFHFSIRSPADMDSWAHSLELIIILVTRLIIEAQPVHDLALLMTIIWARQPLSNFSPELGHVFLHAFALAKQKIEIAELNSGGREEFIMQMLDPSPSRLEQLLTDHFKNNRLPTQYSEGSISYWDSCPSVRRTMELIGYQFDL